MTLPTCSLCIKTESVCTYPTSRKLRAPRQRRPYQRRSAQQELKDKVDHLFKLLDPGNNAESGEDRTQQDTHSRHSNSTTEGTESPSPRPSSLGDELTYLVVGQSSHSFVAEQTSPEGTIQHSSLGIPEMFESTGLSVFVDDTSNNTWQSSTLPPFDSPEVGEFAATNLDWFSSILDSQYVETPPTLTGMPEYQTFEKTPQLPNLGQSENPSSMDNKFALEIPPQLVDELITIYFEKVHCFVPLLHKPRFFETYLSNSALNSNKYNSLSLETSLLLHGMLALSARFSTSPHFDGILPVHRGEQFGEKAKAICIDTIQTLQKPTLKYLQGCILLAVYLYLTEPDSQGWVIIGICCRLAYDLGLDVIDEPTDFQSQTLSSHEWSKREELRRAWWSVWELDAFASAIACRPHAIDRTKMCVKLPVSDQAWFADHPTDSCVIDPNPLHAWHSLRDCPNQDERAWFLLINYLLLIAHGLGRQKRPDPQNVKDIEFAVSCYMLILPSQFHLDSSSIIFDAENFARSNWIISTNLMVQGCRTLIRFLSESPSSSISTSPTNKLLAPLAANSQFGARKMNYQPYAHQVFRTIGIWSPEYIPYNSPFIGCLVLGPAAMNLRVAKDLRTNVNPEDDSPSIEVELLKLAITRIAEFWRFGSLILDLADWVCESDSPYVRQ